MSQHDHYIIPNRLFELVRLAALKFEARHYTRQLPASALVFVCGPPGMGKTTMIEEAARRSGLDVHMVSASTMSGPMEGQSLNPIRDAVIQHGRDSSQPTALLIDDLDLSVARIDDKLTSTSSQTLLNSFLMDYADNPYELSVSHANKPTQIVSCPRPPIIFITVNNMGCIYEPLKRSMRATIFEWIPTTDEMADIVHGLYPGLSKRAAKELAERFPGQPVSFFAQLQVIALDAALKKAIGSGAPFDIRTCDIRRYAEMLVTIAEKASAKQLTEAARQLDVAPTNKNYLGRVASNAIQRLNGKEDKDERHAN